MWFSTRKKNNIHLLRKHDPFLSYTYRKKKSGNHVFLASRYRLLLLSRWVINSWLWIITLSRGWSIFRGGCNTKEKKWNSRVKLTNGASFSFLIRSILYNIHQHLNFVCILSSERRAWKMNKLNESHKFEEKKKFITK